MGLMISKDIWRSYSPTEKKEKLIECLTQLHDIDKKKHNLTGTPKQGCLCNVKKDLEKFIVDVAEWETVK
jgi:hypothetical protein